MDSQTEDAKNLASSDPVAKGLVLGGRVYDPLIFAPDIVPFTVKQYRFLHTYRLGSDIAQAATKAEMSLESAERFLKQDKTVAWLRDRIHKDHIQSEWAEPSKWWAQGDQWLNAPEHLKPSKNEVEIWKEFGKRVSPIGGSESSGTKIEINIDSGALERSKERRQAIEAQIVAKEGEAA